MYYKEGTSKENASSVKLRYKEDGEVEVKFIMHPLNLQKREYTITMQKEPQI